MIARLMGMFVAFLIVYFWIEIDFRKKEKQMLDDNKKFFEALMKGKWK